MLMSLAPRITPTTARRIAAACGTGVLLLGTTACGNGNDPQNTGAQPQGTTTEGGPDTTTQGGQFPGADGKIAAVTDNTAQVQSRSNGQVAVTWNSSTTFTKQIGASLDDIKKGVCVMVQPADGAASSDTETTKVTAGTVRITEKVDGSCTGGLRAGPGGQNGGPQFNGQPPQGGELPEGAQPPSGDASGRTQVRGIGGAFGEVTAVTATGFTVKATVPKFDASSSTPSTEETSVAVTVTDATTYTTTGTGSAADVKVGGCMRAEGSSDSTGAITAKTIALSPATDGECGGVMFRRNGGPAGAGPGTDTDSTRES